MTDRLLLYIREFWRFAGDRIVNWLVLILFLLVLVIATRGYSNTLSSTMRKIRRLLPRLNALAKRRDGKVRHKDIRRAYSSSLMIQRLINAYTYDHRFDIKTRDAQSSVNSAVKMLESFMLAKDVKAGSGRTVVRNVAKLMENALEQLK